MTSVILLGHNGLGDYITYNGAINYLLTIYEHVYFICRDITIKNLEIIYSNPRLFLVPFKNDNEKDGLRRLILPRYRQRNMDILILGCWKDCFSSKIQNNILKNRQKNLDYDTKYIHIKQFYDDMNLDLSIYYNFFNIDSSKKSLELYEKIKLFNIIFLHSTADYKKKINLTTYIDRFVNDENNIIISADYNIYNNEHDKYELAQEYVNQLVPYYIDILKNAQYIYIVDSCFSCIVLPLSYRNELNAIEYKIFDRNSIVT